MSVSVALLIAGAVVLVAVVAGFAARAQDGRRRSGGAPRVRSGDVPGGLPDSVALVQFSTALCARCPQVRRLLDQIAADHGVPRREIDLTDRGDLATRYRVLQTPTTFLVDASGAVVSRWGGVPDRHSVERAVTALASGVEPVLTRQEQS